MIVASIRHKFGIAVAGRVANARMEAERVKQREYREKQADNAKSGWTKRTRKQKPEFDDGLALPSHKGPHDSGTCQTDALQSSSSFASSTSSLTSSPLAPETTGIASYQEDFGLSNNGAPVNKNMSVSGSDVRAVFDHWRTIHPRSLKNPTTDSKEWKLIVLRLREGFTVEDLRDAIDGMHRSPHHIGENPTQTKYLTLELCMRTGSQVSKFIDVPLERGPIVSPQEQRTMAAVNGFAERMAKSGKPNQ